MKTNRLLGFLALTGSILMIFLPGVASAADGFVANQYPATLHGKGSSNFYLSVTGVTTQCEGQTFEGSLNGAGVFTTGSIPNNECTTEKPIEMNGCKYEFHPASGTVTIGPTGCGPVRMHIQGCTANVSPQNLSAKYTNEPKGSNGKPVIGVAVQASGVKYTTSEWSLACGAAGSHENLEITGTWEITATNGSSEQIGVYALLSGAPVGVHMHKNSPYTGSSPLEAEAYPVRLTGEPSTGKVVLAGPNAEWGVSCTSIANSKASEATTTVPFNEYNGCEFLEEPVTVHANGCGYQFSNLEQEGELSYGGSLSIACAQEGNRLVLESGACTFSLPAQSLGSHAVSLWNEGQGSQSKVLVKSESSNESVEMKGPLCFLVGSTHKFKANMSVRGAYAG